MLRWMIVLFVMVQVAQAEVKYFIKFGSFKNLQGLERSIAQLPQGLRSQVVIVQKNVWYIPFAYYTINKQALYPALKEYKRYFPDAHIARDSNMLAYPVVRKYGVSQQRSVAPKQQYIAPKPAYQAPVVPAPKAHYRPAPSYQKPMEYQNIAISEEDHILPAPTPRVKYYQVPSSQRSYQERPVQEKSFTETGFRETPLRTQKVVMKKLDEEEDIFSKKQPKKFKQFSKQMLSGNHYYLAYQKTKSNPSLLIKVTFGNHTVNYQPVIGDMKMTNASYLTEGDRLYMFTDTFMRNGSFSKLEEHRSDHFLVSSWVNGKKLNTLRYYYKLNDAKRYLGLSTSDGLAEVLSEGSYDDLFVEE